MQDFRIKDFTIFEPMAGIIENVNAYCDSDYIIASHKNLSGLYIFIMSISSSNFVTHVNTFEELNDFFNAI